MLKSLKSNLLNSLPPELSLDNKQKVLLGRKLLQKFDQGKLLTFGAKKRKYGIENSLNFLEINKGHDETIVLLHGFADTKENALTSAYFLSRFFNIVIPDIPGFGESNFGKKSKYSLQNYSKWMHRFIEAQGLEQCHLVGNSLGGAIGLQMALDRPQRFKSLTLIDAGGVFLPDGPNLLNDQFLAGENVFDVSGEEEMNALLARVFPTPPFIPPLIMDYLVDDIVKKRVWYNKLIKDLTGVPLGGKQVSGDARQKVISKALNDRVSEITLPTLVAWGENDLMFPLEHGKFLSEKIPAAQLTVFKGHGHCPHLESPREFSKRLHSFTKAL